MGRIINFLTKYATFNNSQIVENEKPEPKIRFSKFAKYWIPSFVSEPLDNNLTLGNKYRLIAGDYPFPEEFYFYDDLGIRQTWYGIVPGYFIYWEDEFMDNEENTKLSEDKKQLIEIINSLTDEEAADLLRLLRDEDFTKEDIEEMEKEIAEGKTKSWEQMQKELKEENS